MSLEYRVIWQRSGRPKRRALYQTEAGADRCAARQESAATDMDWLNGLPEIVFGPVIESRPVGAWEGAARAEA